MEKNKIIEITNLSKYYGKYRGITNINLTVYEGEFFGFIGPNGAGKSTTIRLMLNFLFPNEGTISILDLDAVKDSSVIKTQVGYVPAEVKFYDYMKVNDLLSFAASFHNDIDEERITYLCDKFELDRNRKISELSTGNRKKVSIVQSLIHRPKLLILDEPTSGLDPLMQKTLFDVLKEEQEKGMTVFLSSHNLAEVEKYCDRVGIVKEGKLIELVDVSKINYTSKKKVVIKIDKEIKIKTEGVSDVSYINGELHFKFDGNIKELLLELAKDNIKDISIFPVSLEETFMKYYGN